MELVPSASYALANNVDASSTANWNSGAGFVPVGNSADKFAGSFNGSGDTISGLYINRPSQNYIGLFGWVNTGSLLTNVGLVGGV